MVCLSHAITSSINFSNPLKGFFEQFVHQGGVKTNVGLVILFSILKIKITHSHS